MATRRDHKGSRASSRSSETTLTTMAEFLRAMEAEREDHSPKLGALPSSLVFELYQHRDRWGTVRYGSSEQWNDGPVIKTLDKGALANISVRKQRLTKRAQLAARERKNRKTVSSAGVEARQEKTAPLDEAVRAYLADHPDSRPQEIAKHLRRKFSRPGERSKTYSARIARSMKRVRKQGPA